MLEGETQKYPFFFFFFFCWQSKRLYREGGAQAESSWVREPRRTALPRGSQPQGLSEISILTTETNTVLWSNYTPIKIYFKKYILFKKNKFIYLFNFWLRWVFVAVRGLSLVVASGGYSSLQCTSFSLQWLLLLWSMGSRHAGFNSCVPRALECRLSSCGAQA